jgi:urease accessory protein UreE
MEAYPMSQVYNPESEQQAEIERLELEARDVRRRIERARGPHDRRVLNRQLQELEEQVQFLQARLPRLTLG